MVARNRPFAILASLLLAASATLAPTEAPAAKGDCGQPTSTGTGPKSSDALSILKFSVGQQGTDCTAKPCVCDVNGSGTTTSSDSLLDLKKAVGQGVTLACACMALPTSDNFNDNVKDTDLWSADIKDGNGVLNETNHVLQYTCGSGTSYDQSLRDWIASALPYDADWEVRIDVGNFTNPTSNTQLDSFGISMIDANNAGSEVYAELYSSHYGGPPTRAGFYSELYENDTYITNADTFGLDVTTGAVRMAFDSASKVVHVYYDLDPSDGYTWVEFGSFGLAGSGGSTGNANWGLSGSAHMTVGVYGYSSNMTVAAGDLYGDNFVITGGVAH